MARLRLGRSGGGAGASAAARYARESVTLSLHHGNPLIDGLVNSEACSSVYSSELKTEVGGLELKTTVHQPLFSAATAEGKTLDGATIESKLKTNFWNEEINSEEKDSTGSVVGRRHSVITPHLFTADTVDTAVYDARGNTARTIHSEIHSSTIDTIVKDAAGNTLNELSSKYDRNLFGADVVCTRLK
jgi:hypothetical protein